jgi:hypothetical protein
MIAAERRRIHVEEIKKKMKKEKRETKGPEYKKRKEMQKHGIRCTFGHTP